MEIIGLAVVSVDGWITRHDETGVGFSSPEDHAHFRAALRGCDASIMGRRTFETVRDRVLGSLSTSNPRTIVTRSPRTCAELAKEGVLEFTDASPERIAESLRARGHERVALLGGTQVYDLFVAADLVDEWQITVEPRLFGAGRPLLSARTDRRLTLVEHHLLNDSTLLLRYRTG